MDEVYFRRSVFKSKNSGEKMVRGQLAICLWEKTELHQSLARLTAQCSPEILLDPRGQKYKNSCLLIVVPRTSASFSLTQQGLLAPWGNQTTTYETFQKNSKRAQVRVKRICRCNMCWRTTERENSRGVRHWDKSWGSVRTGRTCEDWDRGRARWPFDWNSFGCSLEAKTKNRE